MKVELNPIRKINKFIHFLRFIRNNYYVPNFHEPKTFNEKIEYRKRNYKDDRYSLCSDKVLVKDWVASKGFEDIIIDTYGVFDKVNPALITKYLLEFEEFFIKANHNSGPVYKINSSTGNDEIKKICDCLNSQVKIDFGKKQNERWYSQIKPRILLEKRITSASNEELRDYKFHIFKSSCEGSEAKKVIVQVDYDRSTNHNRSLFDEDLNWLPFGIEYPSIKTKIDKPKNYDYMLTIAKSLAQEFSYVRVDLYNVDGKVFFGELTFAHGSGLEKFTNKSHDYWMGNLWEL